MFIRRNLLRLLALGFACFQVPVFSLAASDEPPPASSRAVRINRLVGMKVENTDGLPFGKFRDVAIDMQTGEVKYVLVSSGGFLGFRSQLKAVPPLLVTTGTAKRDTLALHVPRTRWNNAPTLRAAGLAALADPVQEQRILDHYREDIASLAPPEPAPGVQTASTIDPARTGSALAPTGQDQSNGPEHANPAALKLAGDIIGSTVLNKQSERLGKVLDLLVRFDTDSPAFVLFSAGKLLRDRNDEFVISARALSVKRDGTVVIDVNRTQLQNAPTFDPRAWSEASPTGEPILYRYGGGS